jgi:hypothetical protein
LLPSPANSGQGRRLAVAGRQGAGEVAGVEESGMAQRMIGYAALDAGRHYPFYLARP